MPGAGLLRTAAGGARPPTALRPHSGEPAMSSGNDMKAHDSTYGSFTGLVKWTAVLVALVAAFVVWLIA
ncbi:MAG: aa3-type cytochrome c oxidase subunit IV [Novosphingobium sp.]